MQRTTTEVVDDVPKVFTISIDEDVALVVFQYRETFREETGEVVVLIAVSTEQSGSSGGVNDSTNIE